MRGTILAGMLGVGLAMAWARAGGVGGTPPADVIVERFAARARAAAADEGRQVMVYRRTTLIEDLEAKDARERRRMREHAVTNAAGVVRARLVRIDDREPSEAEVAADARKEGDARKEATRRRRGPDFVDEALIRKFEYQLEGEEVVDGRRTFRLAYKAGLKGGGTERNVDRFLALIGGRIWIDAEEFELVKASAGLREPLRILGGFAASITRLDFEVTRRPVAPGCWCNVLLTSRAEGRRLFSGFNVRLEVEQADFQVTPLTPASP